MQLRSFRDGRLPFACPDADAEAVSVLAPLLGIGVLLDGYRLCQVTLWQAWFDLVEDACDLDLSQRRELLARGSDFFFRYADLLCGYVTEVHGQHSAQLMPSPEQRRREAVRELLEGDPLAASWLNFDLERHHLGVVAWGQGGREALRDLASALGRPLLVVGAPAAPVVFWGWLSASRPLSALEERVLTRFDPGGPRIVLGLEEFGVAGFRSTHRQALRAMRFAATEGPLLLRYEDVVVEALACENEEDARSFVAHELRGIGDDSPTSSRLRETLRAYFEAGCNAASAGARLGVHQQTVANRLRAAEERLGGASIGGRRVELELALRLRESIGVGEEPTAGRDIAR